jgi:outer membrane protein insertion porin family
VSITPDKEDIYITINVSEGPQYTLSSVRLAGDLPVPGLELSRLVQIRPGDVFSRERLQASTKAISDRLGMEGFAFANVNAVPELDREKRQAAFTIYVDAGRRVYIRRININGNFRTRDEVIRREMRQLESAWYDSTRIERSKVRIRRLGYFEDVNIETPPVPGTTDEVDVDVTVTEKSTGQLLAGVGYSSAEKLVFNASISQQNILGSGNALIAAINTSSVNRIISLSFSQPYFTVDGVSRVLEIYQRNTDPGSLSVSQYTSSTAGAAVGFGIPITETDAVNVGFRYERTNITLGPNSPLNAILYVAEFGNITNSFTLSGGWSRDTRDDILYPSRGRVQSLLAETALPFGNVEYYKVNYLQQAFWPVYGDFVLMLRGDIGYADGYGGTPLPFFKAFFAGGVGSVRGFQQSTLGPQDIFGNATGGKRKIVGNVELFHPILKGDKSVRASVFADAGQIYFDGREPKDLPLEQVQLRRQADLQGFRYSAGVGLAWNSPIGPLKFSYAYPLNQKVLDRIQRFQFQVGTIF